MMFLAMTRAQQGWFWSLALALALACGNLSKSPAGGTSADDGGEPNANTSKAGNASGGSPTSSASGGTSASSAGNATGGLTLTTGGTAPDDDEPFTGGWGAGGFTDYPDAAPLCLYPDDIPANWGAGGAADVSGRNCTVGVLGRFTFMNCLYELLEVTPFDVDPFTGGHSHCCYKSRLLTCK